MSIEFKEAKRENVNLLIGLIGGTGSGKTKSAFELAKGICGDKPFAVIDTESRRALHYADAYRFDHAELNPPFRPSAYLEAILAADKAGYLAIVVDSASHEHAGEGGLLEWHDEELTRMAGDDYRKREACNMASWIRPKTAHKAFVQRLLQVKAHLILCFRAEEKVEMVKGDDGKMKIMPKKTLTGMDGWTPICEKNLPFELTASFLLTCDKPGYPKPIKLQDQHRALFPLNKPITEESGRGIATWASGSTNAAPQTVDTARPASGSASAAPTITADEAARIETRCVDNSIKPAVVKKFFGVGTFAQMTADQLVKAHEMIDETLAKRKEAATT